MPRRKLVVTAKNLTSDAIVEILKRLLSMQRNYAVIALPKGLRANMSAVKAAIYKICKTFGFRYALIKTRNCGKYACKLYLVKSLDDAIASVILSRGGKVYLEIKD